MVHDWPCFRFEVYRKHVNASSKSRGGRGTSETPKLGGATRPLGYVMRVLLAGEIEKQ